MSKITIDIGDLAQISERAYRRGFQQGHHAAQRGDEVRDLHEWRYASDTEQAVPPQANDIPQHSSLERLLIEEDWFIQNTSAAR